MVPSFIEIVACRLGLYATVRDAYDRRMRPDRLDARARFLAFYRQFVSPGDLVFDVGAHEGRWTDRFVELGARVVAIEPMTDYARRISMRYGNRVAVEAKAVGPARSNAELRVGRLTVHSSLAARWIDLVHEEGGDRWTHEVMVDVVTLDDLIARHGVPHFTKIDVEGYEPEALAGLTHSLPLLSFEAQTRAPHLARECVERLQALGNYEFNGARGIELQLAFHPWVDAMQILAFIARIDPRDTGTVDVFARKVVAAH